MVHIANGGPSDRGPIFFNVDQPVGNGGSHNVLNADTQLVQWMLRRLGFFGDDSMGFSGVNDQDTIDAITQFQLANGPFPPDGKVSVAHGVTYGGSMIYTIVRLNALVRDKFRFTGWPVINRFPNATMPPLLFSRISRLFGNDSLGDG